MSAADEIREMEIRFLAKMNAALKRCGTLYQREQCREAYYRLMAAHQDMISEKHGINSVARRHD